MTTGKCLRVRPIVVVKAADDDVRSLAALPTWLLLAFADQGSVAAQAVLVRFRGFQKRIVN